MTNEEILETLLLREEDEHDDTKGQSVNGYYIDKNLKQWDTSKPFPISDFRRYIRMNEWNAKDFNPRTELVILKVLPRWLYLVYLMMKQFKASSRNELLSVQDAFARMMGYPTNTESEKAFCVYDYAIQMYYEKGVDNE